MMSPQKSKAFSLTLAALASGLALPTTGSGQSVSSSAEATIRDTAALFNTDYDETTSGYLLVKFGTGRSAGKSYFKFDFTGQNPNTNYPLTLGFSTTGANGRQHLQVWALNEAYPDMSTALVWASAQANNTNLNNNDLLTTGTYTATPLTDFIASSTVGSKSVVLPPPWGKYLVGSQVVLALTGYNDAPTNSANGCRIGLNTTSLSFLPLVSGASPWIGLITNVTVAAGQASPVQSFAVNDPEDGPDNLSPYAASSSNEAVVSAANVFLGGSGGNRTVYVVATSAGTATITLAVVDTAGNIGQRMFTVTVLPANFPPFALTPEGTNVIVATNTLAGTPVTIPFAVGDAESPASSLVVTGYAAGYSSELVASVAVGADASGTNRTVTVTPASGTNGVAIVTVQLSDTNNNTTAVSFAVMILPAANYAFAEHFAYSPDSSQLFSVAPGFWLRRNSAAQAVKLMDAQGAAYLRPKGGADFGAARLAGAPYTVGSGAVLYLMANVRWGDGAGAGDATVTNSNGSFVHLSNNSTATSALVSEVATRTNSVTDGYFRLGLIDHSGNLQVNNSVDLQEPSASSYKLVTRYDVDAATSTLWVNAVSEASASASGVDLAAPQNISYVGLRQELGLGYIYLDDLMVLVVRKPKLSPLLQFASGKVILSFATGQDEAPAAFAVESAATLDGPFSQVSAAIAAAGGVGNFRAEVPANAGPSFYRVKRLPLNF